MAIISVRLCENKYCSIDYTSVTIIYDHYVLMCVSHSQDMDFTHYVYNSISNVQQYIVQSPMCMFGLPTCTCVRVGLRTCMCICVGLRTCVCVPVACAFRLRAFANFHREFFGLAKI